MMTREEAISIEKYCDEHKISHKKCLEELRIPFWNFYKAKQASRLSLLRIKARAIVRFPNKGRRRQEESYKMHFFECFQYVLA